jgi:hypothetical protein
MNAPGEDRMNTWFHHVYLLRLFDRMLYATGEKYSSVMQHPLRYAKLDDGSPVQVDDPAIGLFLKAIGSRLTPDGASFGDVKIDLRQWLIRRSQGPAMHDLEALKEFFAMGTLEGGWSNFDAICKHICGSTLSQAIAATQVLCDPADPGLHGDVCYSLDLDVSSFEFSAFIERHRFTAMASSLERLLPLVDEKVKNQGIQSTHFKGVADNPLYVKRENDIDRALPAKAYIARNGEPVLSADIRLPTLDCHVYAVAWENAVITMNDKSILRSLQKATPGSAAGKLKGRILEDGLGL